MNVPHLLENGKALLCYQLLAGVTRFEQPTPTKNPGGDCFACSSFAILRHFCGLREVEPPSYETIWGAWASEEIGGKTFTGGSPWVTEKFWLRWQFVTGWQKILFQLEYDPPLALQFQANAFGPKSHDALLFARRVRVYLEAGYLGQVEVQHEPQIDRDRRGEDPLGGDHLIVIDGYREIMHPQKWCDGLGHAAWSGTYTNEIHVVDSALAGDLVPSVTQGVWVDIGSFVKNHGGWPIWWVRPDPRVYTAYPSFETKGCLIHTAKKGGTP